jgi:hypothetical protein
MDISCGKCGRVLGYTYPGTDGATISGWWHAIDTGKSFSQDLNVDHAPAPVAYRVAWDWLWRSGAEPIRDVRVEKLYVFHREGSTLAICMDGLGKLTQEEISTFYSSELDALFSYYKACEFTVERDPITSVRESALEHMEVVKRALRERGWEQDGAGSWIEAASR